MLVLTSCVLQEDDLSCKTYPRHVRDSAPSSEIFRQTCRGRQRPMFRCPHPQDPERCASKNCQHLESLVAVAATAMAVASSCLRLPRWQVPRDMNSCCQADQLQINVKIAVPFQSHLFLQVKAKQAKYLLTSQKSG